MTSLCLSNAGYTLLVLNIDDLTEKSSNLKIREFKVRLEFKISHKKQDKSGLQIRESEVRLGLKICLKNRDKLGLKLKDKGTSNVVKDKRYNGKIW